MGKFLYITRHHSKTVSDAVDACVVRCAAAHSFHQPRHAAAFAHSSAITQNQEINAVPKWHAAASAPEVARYFRRGLDTHRFEQSGVLMRKLRLQPLRPRKMVHIALRAEVRDVPEIHWMICWVLSERNSVLPAQERGARSPITSKAPRFCYCLHYSVFCRSRATAYFDLSRNSF